MTEWSEHINEVALVKFSDLCSSLASDLEYNTQSTLFLIDAADRNGSAKGESAGTDMDELSGNGSLSHFRAAYLKAVNLLGNSHFGGNYELSLGVFHKSSFLPENRHQL